MFAAPTNLRLRLRQAPVAKLFDAYTERDWIFAYRYLIRARAIPG